MCSETSSLCCEDIEEYSCFSASYWRNLFVNDRLKSVWRSVMFDIIGRNSSAGIRGERGMREILGAISGSSSEVTLGKGCSMRRRPERKTRIPGFLASVAKGG